MIALGKSCTANNRKNNVEDQKINAIMNIIATQSENEDFSNATVVAVDKDKHSQSAVKWAIDCLLTTSKTLLVLLHVRVKNRSSSENNGGYGGSDANGSPCDAESSNVFVSFRAYGARKGVTIKEVILDDTDVSRALLDYINKYHVSAVVLGASSRLTLTRKFWTHDVPTIINKAAPEYCSVYVIAKGKTQSIRPAAHPFNSLPSAQPLLPHARSPGRPYQSDPEDTKRFLRAEQRYGGNEISLFGRGGSSASLEVMEGSIKVLGMEGPNRSPAMEGLFRGPGMEGSARGSMMEVPLRGHKNHYLPNANFLHDDTDFSTRLNALDVTVQNLDTSFPEAPSGGGASSNNIEAEMKRLKLELKQTMDMYNSACKEAVSAKQRALEFEQWKMEEARRFEQARLAEESALKIAEMEKARAAAAMEAAEKSQKLLEMEAQRRRYAEQKAKREAHEKTKALNVLSHTDVRYRKYLIEEIEAATDKFSHSMRIGEGGYGPVFLGKLHHTPVAIKVLRPDATQGKKQFQQEVEVLSCMRHPNLVLLLGACPEYGCLVYEYMDNGSLEDRLFRKGNTPPIPWYTRFKIAADIARGLLFLHQAKPEPLVHRDLKPANILLDRNFTCKISDVGLARLVPPSFANSVTQSYMTSAAGTFCYIDPEYQQTGKLGTKSDIYSLGVLLLQIITARPPMGLTHHIERAIDKEKFADLLDPTVPDWPVEEALSFAKLALKCAELRKKGRPDLASEIVPELNRLSELGSSSMSS